jgi:hypothetical protein
MLQAKHLKCWAFFIIIHLIVDPFTFIQDENNDFKYTPQS